MALTAKQGAFVREYLIDLNATQAAIRAGYSEATAYSAGQRLLKHVETGAAIQQAMNNRSERTEITADYVLTGIQEVIAEARDVNRHNEALRGYELLGKHLKLFTDKVEHTGKDGGAIEQRIDVTRLSLTELQALRVMAEKSMVQE